MDLRGLSNDHGKQHIRVSLKRTRHTPGPQTPTVKREPFAPHSGKWFPDFDILVSLYFQIVMYFTIIMENTKKGSIGYAWYAAITRATRHFQPCWSLLWSWTVGDRGAEHSSATSPGAVQS